MNNDLPIVINIHEYDKHLSAFGRKVIGVLIKQYRTGAFTRGKNHFRKNTVNRHEVLYYKWQRRNEKSSSLTGTNLTFTNVNFDIDNNIFVNQENMINSPNDLNTVLLEKENTPTIENTVELLRQNEDSEIVAIDTNLNMTTDLAEIVNSQLSFSSNTGKDIAQNLTLHLTENNEVLESTKQVAWEDMLDCDILNIETCNNVENTQRLNEKNILRYENNIFENLSCNKKPKRNKNNSITGNEKLVIETCDDISIKNNNIEKANEKNIVDNNNKVFEHSKPQIKRKGKNKNNFDSTDTMIAVTKKVAKVTEKKLKSNFLKRKNTKAFNNWLNNVDPTHSVDDIDVQSEVLITNAPNTVTENLKDILQTLENVEFHNKRKKMVQAQIITKNGVIKFSKPNSIKDFTKILDKDNSTVIEKNKIKMKTCKFVAPIKSQDSSKNI